MNNTNTNNGFQFSEKVIKMLRDAGKRQDKAIFIAAREALAGKVKATAFAGLLRENGLRCNTGVANKIYACVRKDMSFDATMEEVALVGKSKPKTDAGKTDAGKADAGKADAGKADAGKADAGTGTADTLVGALQAACKAAQAGHIEVVETWLVKAQAILEAAKLATAQAVERMNGVA